MHDLPMVGGPADDADATLLAGLPDDPSALLWPSQVWNTHLATCPRPRRCPHIREVALPNWWVAKMKRGAPLAADIDTAMAMAMKRVNTYRGGKHVSEIGAAFARDAVRDALPSAPQPVSQEWVSAALAITGGFATWVHNQGEPLIREHVFAEATRRRWLTGRDGPMHLSEYSRRNYRLRLDIMASILLGSPRETITGRKPLGQPGALLPLTRQQEADLWVWSEGLRPKTVRARIQAVIVTGLGVGARRRDFVCVRALDVSRDEHGVHVAFPATTLTGNSRFPARTTTCLEAWEDRLWDLAQSMPPRCYLSAPWRTTQPDRRVIDATMRNVMRNEAACPPVDFSSESLRNTWIVRHLEAGIPPKLLMAQGALKSTVTIEKLLPFVDLPDPVEASAWMRRSQRP